MAVSRFPNTPDVFAPLFEEFLRPAPRGNSTRGLLGAPEADVVETEKDIMVVVDVPGCTPGDIELILENNLLTINGERRSQWGEGDDRKAFHLAERRYGRFNRAFVLPRDVNQDGIIARFENGVLTVTIPKSEKARRRRIEIQGADVNRQVDGGTEVH
ncbi:MAG: Hsp20/alpha crystallin family protein [Gemmatimonadetes bacterium]|nr:Hsp20/alpha crystallin family protein [Gemmatimonadota bacterium]